MKKVNVGVIGVGALGRHHTRLYKQCDEVNLVGVYDADADHARAVADEFEVPVFADMNELVSKADALSVAVPTTFHYGVVKFLLEQGRHVLVEKPLAATVAEGRELVALAAAKALVFGVGHVERFNPVLECLEEVPGTPRFIEAERLAPYPPPRPGLPPRGTEVSVVHDLMIHDIDVVLALVKSPVQRVDSVGVSLLSKTEDIVNTRIQFENGCVANLTASRVSKDRVRKIRVFKTGAYLSLDYQEQCGEMASLTSGGITRMQVPAREGNALQQELRDFARCVAATLEQGELVHPKVSGADGLNALELAEQVIGSILRT